MLRAMRRLVWLLGALVLVGAIGCKKKAEGGRAPGAVTVGDAAAARELDSGVVLPERWGGKVELPGAAVLLIEVRFKVDRTTAPRSPFRHRGWPPPSSSTSSTPGVAVFTLAPRARRQRARRFTAKRNWNGKAAQGSLNQNGRSCLLDAHVKRREHGRGPAPRGRRRRGRRFLMMRAT